MATTFNLYQQVFALSAMSNWDSGPSEEKKTVQELESDLAAKIDSALASSQLQNLIGTWKRVWGPVIFQYDNSGVADNAMYVAQGTDGDNQPVYVVAIAGTNAISAYDAQTEDLDVGTLAPLPSNPSGPQILSQGTFFGVQRLEAMVYPNPATGASSLSLVQYLNGLGSTGGTLIFTGHSLGGALSPALAVDLVSYGGLQTDNFKDIYVYPTAGPTPGTSEFASLFTVTFPLISTSTNTYQSWNGLVWNNLDIVPHAWAQLGQIRSLYEPSINIPLISCISTLVGLAEARAASAGRGVYAQIQSSGAMQGTFNNSLPSTGDAGCDFLQQAYYQHIAGYFEMLGVHQLLTTGFFNLNQLPSGFCGTFKQKFCKV